MNFKNVASVIAAVSALIAQGAMAQTPAAPAGATRADVKSDAAAAKKKGELTPAGEGVGAPPKKAAAKSETSRAAGKAEAAAAKKRGDKTEAGEAGARVATPAKSDTPRAEVKAETAAAKKKGELTPAGEGVGTPPKK